MSIPRTRPSGKPSWPIILLAGIEGSGKSWTAAEATGMDRIGNAYWVEIGERMADEYGNVPGADFEIFRHDGSFTQILASIREAGDQPLTDGKPNLLIVDSITEVWDLLSNEQQAIANNKRGRKGGDATITMDQWNAAKKRWGYVVSALRAFPGPVIVTARLDNVAVVGGDGRPTGASTWKIRAEKNLPFEVQVIMQAREPRQWVLTKIASTQLILPEEGHLKWPRFSVADLLERMGLVDVQPSTYVEPNADRAVGEADQARTRLLEVLKSAGLEPAAASAEFAQRGHGDLRQSDDAAAIADLIDFYASAVPA
ncbi:AAA family ATPase [Rhodococcus sp. BE178]|uniref:AAA family ATPase n=1 Tax=Rhodococcus sp. BE178 TaxID=2817737 RepID=UPI003D242982